MKRILLFMAVNLLVMVTISILWGVVSLFFDVGPQYTAQGINIRSLALFCIVWGFGGAFISLGLSRIMAKWMMGVKVIDPATRDADLRGLVETVHQLANRAGLSKMPQVGVYESPEVNAFATGPSKNRSLVAVSSGLLTRLNKTESAGVLAHEVAHIANGDMVTMTLIQGVVNAFVMFIARIVAYAIAMNVREESRFMVHFITVIVLQIALGILGMIPVAYFSRLREFRADAGGAALAGRDSMVGALQALQRSSGLIEEETHASMATLKISGKSGGFRMMFATHPPLEERIRRLQRAQG